MRIEPHRYGLAFFQRIRLAAFLALLLLGQTAAKADDVEPTQIQAEIMLLQDMSETQMADSLKQLVALLEHLPSDAREDDRREAIEAVIDLYIQEGQQAKAAKLNADLGALGSRFHDERASAMALDYESVLQQDQGKYEEAIATIDKALLIASRVKDKKLTSRVNSTASIAYSAVGKFQKALEFQLVAIDTLEEGNRHAELRRISAMNNIGTLYESLKNPQAALEYFLKAGRLAKSLDAEAMLATLALNRGIAYADLDKTADAAQSYLEALEISRKISDPRTEATAMNNLSDLKLGQNRYAECVQYAEDTIPLAEKVGDKSLAATAYVNLGLCRINLGNIQQGAADTKRGMDFFRNSKATPQVELILEQLAEAYEHAGQYQEALKALKEQRKLSEELFRTDRDRALSELQAKFDAAEREKQIEVLEQKNQLQGVEIKNKSLQRIVAILATLAALAVAAVIALLYRKVRRSNLELQETNQKLEQQSTRDPLTGLYNRRAFQDVMRYRSLSKERRALDPGLPPHALVLLDIDYFKLVNDTYGHAGGDLVLIELGRRLSQIMREEDMLMRWGGEEFLVYLSHIPAEHLPPIIERLLNAVGDTPILLDEGQSIRTTTSAGYISLPHGGNNSIDMNWEKALHLADTALYMAKTRGRNQAIGITVLDYTPVNFAKLMQGDLEEAVKLGLAEITHLAGPLTKPTLVETTSNAA
ncbi:MAG TPA: tetratricopeptide repeat-containing diguanylate cyclase [Burkholderiaceae bacterium]|jgi:diguanylate cyclase (GGDEF)-like protein